MVSPTKKSRKSTFCKLCFILSMLAAAVGLLVVIQKSFETKIGRELNKRIEESKKTDEGKPTTTSSSSGETATTVPTSPTFSEEHDPMTHPDAQERIKYFRDTAISLGEPVTDKVFKTHAYHNMYGMFLLPFAANKPTLKFLEIGLGCDMNYGPGASVKVWRKLLPKAEKWEAEFDGACVEAAKQKNQLDGFNTLVGDQGDVDVLDSWIKDSGGNFDIIIDDGGHTNCQISNTLDKLWPQLNPGGLYFIEDMHAGRRSWYQKPAGSCEATVLMKDKINDWNEQLINGVCRACRYKYALPKDLAFVHCQAHACVLGKVHSAINYPATDA